MNAVCIDVSKGTSTVAILRPFGEIVSSPFEVAHTDSELSKLASLQFHGHLYHNPLTNHRGLP